MNYEISDAEWQIMHVIREHGKLTAQEVISHLEKTTDWSPAIIKTMLHRLVRKKILNDTRKKNRYLSFSKAKREDCIRKAPQSFLQRVFEGGAAPMLAHFVRTAPLSPGEIAELKKLLKDI